MTATTALVIIFCILLMFTAGAIALWFSCKSHVSADMAIGIFFMTLVFISMMFALIMKLMHA